MKKFFYFLAFATLFVACGDDNGNSPKFTEARVIEFAEQFDKAFETQKWDEVNHEGSLTEEYNDWYHHYDNPMTSGDYRKILNDWAKTDSQKAIAKWLADTSLSRGYSLFDECREEYLVAKYKEQGSSVEKEIANMYDKVLDHIKAGNAMDAIAQREAIHEFLQYSGCYLKREAIAASWAGVDELKKVIAKLDITDSRKRYPILAQYWNDLNKYHKEVKASSSNTGWVD